MEKCNFLFKSLVAVWYLLSLHTHYLSLLLKITSQPQKISHVDHHTNNLGYVNYTMAMPFYILKKSILKAKEESWKFKYFTMQKYT
jgi:hypothetical protein